VSLFVLLLIVDPDVFAAVTVRLPFAVELPDFDPLEEASVEEDRVELGLVDVSTAVCPAPPVRSAVPTVPFPLTAASVALLPPTEVAQFPLLVEEPPAPAEVPELREVEDNGPVGRR
jgi:hypothetical protein